MSGMSTSRIKTKISDLVECFKELLAGVPLETLYQKYPRVEVLTALELRHRGITLRELEDFIAKRDAHLSRMRREKL